MQIPRKVWNKYINTLSKISSKASQLMGAYITKYGLPETYDERQALLDYANSLTLKYGEGAAELACEMYDAIGALEGMVLPSAVPADVMDYGGVAKAINGTMKHTQDTEVIASVVGRMVKQANADTMLQNAQRDNAQWAWIPSGDTCAFCIALASRGWQPASKAQLDGGHAEHIHSNCDCNFAIRFSRDTTMQDYNPDEYLEMYENADTSSYGMQDGHWQNLSTAKINGLRREFYAKNKAKINAQKRDAYEKRKERESDKAEEINVD